MKKVQGKTILVEVGKGQEYKFGRKFVEITTNASVWYVGRLFYSNFLTVTCRLRADLDGRVGTP